jgi:hypothetical protein
VFSAPPDEAVAIEVRGEAGAARSVASSCSEVLGEGRCKALDAPLQSTSAHWYVVVVFANDARVQARIEVRRATSSESVAARDVQFAPDDSPEERHRAVGLIAAAQVLALEPDLGRKPEPEPPPPEPEPEPEPPPPEPEPEPPHPEPETTKAPTARRWGFDLGAFGGPFVDRGAPRFGLAARPFVQVLGPLLVEVSLRAALRPDEPSLFSGSAGLGLGLLLTPEHAELEVRTHLAFVAHKLVASARDDSTGERDTSQVVQLGPAIGADLAWPGASDVSFVLGAELEAPRPRIRLELRGRDAGRQPSVLWTAGAGVRLWF